MKKLLLKIKRIALMEIGFKKRKQNNKIEGNNNSVVYINKPINEINNDVLGINTHLNRIDKAIDKGANVIGIIGDYGTGKSSLIELLKNKYEKPIMINMWNYSNANSNEDDGINGLTRNFLFQMAIGEDTKFAQYVNKKLSKNYGILSIIKSGEKFWRNFIPAIVFWIIYKIGETFPNSIYDTAAYKSLNNAYGANFFPDGLWQNIIYVLYGFVANFYIIFALVALFFAIKAILKTTIVFSLWDSQGKRCPDATDIYDIYLEVAQRILKGKNKRIVIIEDLDRINDIEKIKEFIKEIYRFNNVLPENLKNKLVYVIEVKSEEAMSIIENQIEEVNIDKLFKKVFYFKVLLNPIHNMDCDEIVLDLLKNQEERINKQLGIKLGNTLPEEFAYIVKGTNLTIRDLKDRLNRSFEIYENLDEKGKKTGAIIDFRKCTIVAYLESKYPQSIRKFVTEEEYFKNLLNNSYVIKQMPNVSLTDKKDRIKKLIDIKIDDDFKDEVANLIANDLINDDFRLYFYNYPKGQKIKSSEEEYVEQLLLYPSKNEEVDEEKIKKALKEDSNIVYKCLDRRRKENLLFDRTIFESETLYSIAIKFFYDKVQELLQKDIKWKSEYRNESGRVLNKISKYNVDSKNLFEEYSKFLTKEFKQLSEKELIGARAEIIKNSNEYITCFKSIFINDDISLISKEEIDLIEDIGIVMQLVNTDAIDEKNAEYIINILNANKLSDENFICAKEIYYSMDETIELESIAHSLLDFLMINNKTDDLLFKNVVNNYLSTDSEIEEIEIVKYLNLLDINDITEEYLNNIDLLKITEELSEDILNKLKENGLKHTLWINLIIQDRCNEVDLSENYEENLKIISEISDVLDDSIINLRKELISKNLSNEYKELFFDDYPIITPEELGMLDTIGGIINLTNFNKVDINNLNGIVNKINNLYSTGEELIEIIGVFDKKENSISDINITNKFFDIFEWNKDLVKMLTEDQRSYIYNVLKNNLRLTDYNYEIKFSHKIGYIITEIDNELYIKAKNDINCYEQYMELVNQLDIPTEQTITNIINFNSEYKLNINITNYLWSKGYYTESIIGRILFENSINVKLAKESLNLYAEAYNKTEKAHDIMASNDEFIQLMMDNENYKEFKTKKKLEPFYRLRQPITFVKHVFETLEETDIYEYLKCSWHLDTEEDSEKFQRLICEDRYIKFIESSEMYNIVWEKLWKTSHKGLLTKARNKRYNN